MMARMLSSGEVDLLKYFIDGLCPNYISETDLFCWSRELFEIDILKYLDEINDIQALRIVDCAMGKIGCFKEPFVYLVAEELYKKGKLIGLYIMFECIISNQGARKKRSIASVVKLICDFDFKEEHIKTILSGEIKPPFNLQTNDHKTPFNPISKKLCISCLVEFITDNDGYYNDFKDALNAFVSEGIIVQKTLNEQEIEFFIDRIVPYDVAFEEKNISLEKFFLKLDQYFLSTT